MKYKRPFVYDTGDLFLCPYCKGKLLLRIFNITEIDYDEHGVLDYDNNLYTEKEEIICSKCGTIITDKTKFDIDTMTRHIDKSNTVKLYGKTYNPLYDKEDTYEL